MDARWWPIREECLVHYCDFFFNPKHTTTSIQEGPHKKMFFHLQESEDERPCSLFNGNHFSSLFGLNTTDGFHSLPSQRLNFNRGH